MSATEIGRIAVGEESGRASMSVEAAMAAVTLLDLASVKRKVIEEKGWRQEIADYAELRYRRFLCMHLLDPGLILVPPPDIDVFWHQHILFTRAYAVDCARLFGTYFHHSPATGDADEAAMMQRGVLETAKFYADAFGQHYFATEPAGFASNWMTLFD
ncbi:glycine-rich domain-containing protein [Reyranella sp.]|uniref:glycine-rich domain-containing protein n=1 Tax=Reyranella sp. TaxID=1929291 RepID=UPI003D0DB58E